MAAESKPLKQLAREIFSETLAGVDIAAAFRRKVRRQGRVLHFDSKQVDLAPFRRIWVISFGKAAWACYDALVEALGEAFRPTRGMVISNVPARDVPAGFAAFHAGHPVPNAQSFAAADAILSLLCEADQQTLVFFCISGGGSALVERPLEPGISLDDMKELNRWLVGCGGSIEEINTVRKHLSAVKGGRLREAAGAAQTVTILLSDVPEGKPATVASGPTLPDPSTLDSCYQVVERYGLLEKFPASIRTLFEEKRLSETPKGEAEAFRRAQTLLLLSSADVLAAARQAAGERGFVAETEMRCDDWELSRAAALLLERLEEMRRKHPGRPVAIVSGGEILHPVSGDGQGGRNQAFVLYVAEQIAGQEVAVLSAGTDGIDGNSPAAGAVADGETLRRVRERKLDPQEFYRRSDSYHFFEALGDTIIIGAQQNNLRDLRLLLSR